MKIPTTLLVVLLSCMMVSMVKAAGDDPMDLVKERLNRKLSRNRYGEDEQVRS